MFNSKQFKIDEKGRILFPKRKYKFDFKIKSNLKNTKLIQIRIVPEATCFKCEVVYEK